MEATTTAAVNMRAFKLQMPLVQKNKTSELQRFQASARSCGRPTTAERSEDPRWADIDMERF